MLFLLLDDFHLSLPLFKFLDKFLWRFDLICVFEAILEDLIDAGFGKVITFDLIGFLLILSQLVFFLDCLGQDEISNFDQLSPA